MIHAKPSNLPVRVYRPVLVVGKTRKAHVLHWPIKPADKVEDRSPAPFSVDNVGPEITPEDVCKIPNNPWVQTSVSAMDDAEQCLRLGWLKVVKGLSPPQQKDAEIGEAMHAENEKAWERAHAGDPARPIIPPKPINASLRTAIRLGHLPNPENPPAGTVQIEREFWIRWGGLWVRGYMDCVIVPPRQGRGMGVNDGSRYAGPHLLRDVKTKENAQKMMQYLMTPAQLAEELQLGTYSWALYEEDDADHVEPAHVYLSRAEDAQVLKREIHGGITRKRAEEFRARGEGIIDRFRPLAQIADPALIPPTHARCDKYGGCEFRSVCRVVDSPAPVSPAKRAPASTWTPPPVAPVNPATLAAMRALLSKPGTPPVQPPEAPLGLLTPPDASPVGFSEKDNPMPDINEMIKTAQGGKPVAPPQSAHGRTFSVVLQGTPASIESKPNGAGWLAALKDNADFAAAGATEAEAVQRVIAQVLHAMTGTPATAEVIKAVMDAASAPPPPAPAGLARLKPPAPPAPEPPAAPPAAPAAAPAAPAEAPAKKPRKPRVEKATDAAGAPAGVLYEGDADEPVTRGQLAAALRAMADVLDG